MVFLMRASSIMTIPSAFSIALHTFRKYKSRLNHSSVSVGRLGCSRCPAEKKVTQSSTFALVNKYDAGHGKIGLLLNQIKKIFRNEGNYSK